MDGLSGSRCKHKDGLFDPKSSFPLYCGTVLHIKLFQTKSE